MRLTVFLLLVLSNLLIVSIGYSADVVPPTPNINAKAFLLMDSFSGKVLTGQNVDARIEPASLTKLMSAYVLMSEIKKGTISINDQVRISEKAWRTQGSKMFVEVNKTVLFKDLLMGMIIQSGNDATIALAEHTAGSEEGFTALMNQYARQLGMKNSNFVNSTGWPDPNHYTTAMDLAILTRALITDFPEHYSMYKIQEYTYNNIWQFNRNPLLKLDKDVDGVKTGHTDSAGYCLIGSALKNNMRLISVVIGASSDKARETASMALLNYGFRFYETVNVHLANSAITTPEVFKGEKNSVPLGLNENLYVTIPRGKRDHVQANVNVNDAIIAPIIKGKQYGQVEIKVDDQTILTRPLVALETVKQGGLWRRAVDSVKLWFE
ncbi:MAG: D-alanyl-D-alanine carboxypeptidase [Gammaproteobacteria bacterium]|nr:D-alanyl-D-alanine carboxypeptidase [Gammaproteobacteria bacterium]